MVKSFYFHIGHKHYRFKLNIGFFLLCLFFVALFCKLGFWQLYRYHYKKDLQQSFNERLTSPPKAFAEISDSKALQFQKVKLQGTYVNDLTLLLQNQFYNDRLGYDVLTPVQIPGDKKLLLVDRGWIPRTDNEAIPHIAAVTGIQQITGYIKILDEHQFILGKNILDTQTFPLVLQKIDMDEISRVTHQTFYPFILRLNASVPNGFIRDWTITSVMPERHMGYAVQWFAMAFALLIAYLVFCCERVNHAKQ